MRSLSNPKWIIVKGVLFLCLAALSSALLLLDAARGRDLLLLAVAVWAFCRWYYFVFYVIERYVDPTYRFSGLFSIGRHLVQRLRRDKHG